MLIKLAEYIKPTRSLKYNYLGVVVDNKDPKQLGRIKVSIKGLFEHEAAKLPWCYPRGDNNQALFIPNIGSKVEISFPYDDVYTPVYNCSRPDETNKKVALLEDYPDSWGWEDTGFSVKYNRKKQEFSISHSSGSKLQFKQDGTIEIQDNSGAKLKLAGGKVALGKDEEVVDLVSQLADLLSQSLGNLGYPLSNSVEIAAIKTKADSIKGNL